MKTIKVFLASSDELADERQKFGNLIRRLDDVYIKRGIHVQLLVWEDMDPCYNNVRKQDEYNAWIRDSDIFVCLFSTRAGQYTLEELDVAKQENVRRQMPKLMIYCRDLQPNEVEMPDLMEFKQRMENEMGHFWGHYPTTDKLHLDFVMFLMRSEEGNCNSLKVENGDVMFDNFCIASMDYLPFAAENRGYQKMKEELGVLSEEIENMQQDLEKKKQKLEKRKAKLDKNPDDEDYQEDYQEAKEEVDRLIIQLQPKLDKKNALEDELSNHQQALLATAQRISEMQFNKISHKLQQAISEFEIGRVEGANAILSCIEQEAEQHLYQLDRDRTLIHQDIEAMLLKTKTLIADVNIPVEERILQTWDTYKKAKEWAERSEFPKESYANLLLSYGVFLLTYDKLDDALDILRCVCNLNEEIYGTNHKMTARSYSTIGMVYHRSAKFDQALEYYKKAQTIMGEILGEEHPETISIYDAIGMVYSTLGKYDQALVCHKKSSRIFENVLGEKHPITIMSYNNIGMANLFLGKFDEGWEYIQKAMNLVDEENPIATIIYINIGFVLCKIPEFHNLALEALLKALSIQKKILGTKHADVALTYNNIGMVYMEKDEYNQALEYFQKACEIYENMLGERHCATAGVYNNIGMCYANLNNDNQALLYLKKALSINKEILGEGHPMTKDLKNNFRSINYIVFFEKLGVFLGKIFNIINFNGLFVFLSLSILAILGFLLYYFFS